MLAPAGPLTDIFQSNNQVSPCENLINKKLIYEKQNICYQKYCYKMKIFSIVEWGVGPGQNDP